jgi:dolichol-phosphate mannosyltransferase
MNKISVLLVSRNEEAVIQKMIDGLIASYPREINEIVVVDDASSDGTAARVKKAAELHPGMVKLINREPPWGVGRAIKAGLREIAPGSDCVLSMDSDFLGAIGDVRLLLDAAAAGADAVMGSRFCPGGKRIGYGRAKLFCNRLFHFLVRWILGIRQADVTNNFKLYKRDLFLRLPLRSDHFGVNAEIGILPVMFGVKAREVPVTWCARAEGMGWSKFSILQAWPDYCVSFCWCAWKLFLGRARLICVKSKI